jgi:hypothetical protein
MADASSSDAALGATVPVDGGADMAPLNDAVGRLKDAAARGDTAAVLDELSAHGADVAVAQAALLILLDVDYRAADGVAVSPSAAPVAHAVVAALRQHASDAGVQADGLHVLSAVAKTQNAKQIVADAGAAAAAVAAMRAHTDVDTQLSGALMLLQLVPTLAHARALKCAGVVEVVVQALRMHLTSECIQCFGCWLLTSLITEQLENQRVAVAAGAVEAVLDALRTHGTAVDVVKHAMGALGSLVAFNPVSNERAGRAGAAAALMPGMRAHESNVDVQRCASGALHNLLCLTPNRPACIAAGATEAVLAALRAHPADFVVQRHGWSAVSMLAAGNKRTAATAAHLGAVDVAAAALRAFREDAVVVQHACSSVRIMLSAVGPGAIAVEPGAAAAALAVLHVHHTAPDVTAAAMGALAMLAHGGCVREGPEAGCIRDAVIEALQAHGAHTGIQVAGVTALSMLMPVALFADRQQIRLTMRITLDAMRCHATDVKIQALSAMLLNGLLEAGGASHAADACELGAMAVVTAALQLHCGDSGAEPNEKTVVLHKEGQVLLRRLRAAPRPAAGPAPAARRATCAFPGCSPDGGAAADQPLPRCSGCRAASYCCAAHQRADWARHRPECLAARAANVRI